MVWIRKAAAALLLFLLAPVVLSGTLASTSVSAVPMSLSGVVRDEVGKVIEGVEVLVLAPEGHGNDALLRAVSDAGGRFLIAALPPGVYRIAAIKSGYIASLGRVNTMLRSSVDLVLRPIPRDGQPGAETVQHDLSWTLRVPTRSILRELDPGAVLASHDTGGARTFARRVQESVRGEVDQVFAIGSWRGGTTGGTSSLEGNETRMRLAGSLGERGAIQVRGRHGSLDSSSQAAAGAVSRGASDVDVDVTYNTAIDENLAMRAFYSSGALAMAGAWGVPESEAKQSQRSFGYDALWRKQVDASSNVALKVGFQDSTLGVGQGAVAGWVPPRIDASNRGIGATASYENRIADGHLLHFAMRAQRLSFEAPALRSGRDGGSAALDGPMGWNLLVDSEDQWSVAGPVAVTYGLAVRQGFDGSEPTALTPRVGGVWTAARSEGRLAVSYFGGVRAAAARSPIGYEMEWKTRLDPTVTLSGTVSYVPSRADVAEGQGIAPGFENLYVSDGFVSDRFVALEVERAAPSAAIAFRVARGRADGALASALDEAPVALLADRSLDYDAARITVKAPRAGSAVSVGYWSTKARSVQLAAGPADVQRTLGLELSQDLVRFAGGRASCRLLVTARAALRPGTSGSDAASADARRYGAEDKRAGAGVSLAF